METIYQLLEYFGVGALRQRQNEYSAFVQDNWSINARVTLDLGLRYDRDQIGAENNFAPRLGFVVLPAVSERTVVRGGIGLFYDKIPLNVGAFEQYQNLRVTTFGSDGVTVTDGPRLFRNNSPADLKNPYSIAGNVQVDHEVNSATASCALVMKSATRAETLSSTAPRLLDPAGSEGALLLKNDGASRYREFQALARFRFQEGQNIFVSYVRSRALGNLNDYNTYFGNLRHAVIRPDESWQAAI